jgi:hypothetical protein
MATVSIVIAGIALSVSLLTAWLTLLRRGTVCMTRPTVIYFGPDGGPPREDRSGQKVYLRALLYSTSKRGRIFESMYVRVRRGETSQNFNIWVYGDRSLERGSGLFVGETGVAANHHFILPADGTQFEFLPGVYDFEVYGSLVGGPAVIKLFSERLQVPADLAGSLKTRSHGLFFDWGADSQAYHPHVRKTSERLPGEEAG